MWYLGGLDYNTTVALYLDIANSDAKVTHHRQANFIQFQTMYLHSSGQRRLRVTTVSKRFADETLEDFKAGFDQEAACVSIARQCVEKAEKEEPLDILKWTDRTLIRLI